MIKVITEGGMLKEITLSGEDAFNLHKLLKILFKVDCDAEKPEIPFDACCLINNTLTAIAHPYFGEFENE